MDYNGAVKALLGGRNWNKSKFNRAAQSKRQLRVSFKTYVYLTALSMGYNLNDKIKDTPFKEIVGIQKIFLINMKVLFLSKSFCNIFKCCSSKISRKNRKR